MRRLVILSCTWLLSGLAAAVGVNDQIGSGDLNADQHESAGVNGLPVVDAVLVRKGERRMYLMRRGEIVRTYHVALGLMPEGGKEHAGDFRTPEGSYRLTRRNPHSDYFLSIQVSYPNDSDLHRARANHWNPGGSIMIHGLPTNLRHPVDYYQHQDWTDGCIALSNSDMVEFWLITQDNIPIQIEP
jgi:murein L,D-transpeptidase YafK